MTVYKGYYLVEISPSGNITSWDGSHEKSQDVSHAVELWTKLHFIKPEHTYKMIQLKEDVETNNMQEMFKMLQNKGCLKFKKIKEQSKYKKPRKVNEEAINIINNIRTHC